MTHKDDIAWDINMSLAHAVECLCQRHKGKFDDERIAGGEGDNLPNTFDVRFASGRRIRITVEEIHKPCPPEVLELFKKLAEKLDETFNDEFPQSVMIDGSYDLVSWQPTFGIIYSPGVDPRSDPDEIEEQGLIGEHFLVTVENLKKLIEGPLPTEGLQRKW
jgi:hypothetical protein